ncbi:unnamed protein product [Durusdinium trenchii]|uniref:Uncharacterized protein n=1 Tax=Durusdinium trenchii TaxID=1381693 RepID=A0ABP0R5Z5_9DINO
MDLCQASQAAGSRFVWVSMLWWSRSRPCDRAMLPLLFLLLYISPSDASRGEASLEAASTRLSMSGVMEHCQRAVDTTRTASETIKALQQCIGLLEEFAKEGNQARTATKRSGQQYSADMNLLGSFLQSLESRIVKTYKKHQHSYEQLRSDQHQAFSGFLERLQTMKDPLRSPLRTPTALKARRSQRSWSSGHVRDPLRDRSPRPQGQAHQAPSFLQISDSEDEGDEISKMKDDLQKLQESVQRQKALGDQEVEVANERSWPVATSLLQLSAAEGEPRTRSNTKDNESSASSLLEEENGGLSWTLHHIVGFGLTDQETPKQT